MTTRTYGSKFDNALSTKEIAARIRKDIQAAIKAGNLPKGTKVSVKTEYSSMSAAINLCIKDLPGVEIYSNAYINHMRTAPGAFFRFDCFSDDAAAARTLLKQIADAYNYDGSDSMCDHFDVRFYGSIQFDVAMANAEYSRRTAA